MKPVFDAMEKISDKLVSIQLEQAKYSNEEGVRYASDLSKRIITTILCSVLAFAAIVFVLSKKIIAPLRNIIVNITKFSSQLQSTSINLKSAAADQAEQTILAIKLSQSISNDLKLNETMDALYAIDESSKQFASSAFEVGNACEKLNGLSKDLYKVIGSDSDPMTSKTESNVASR
jgi:hypothetical protein